MVHFSNNSRIYFCSEQQKYVSQLKGMKTTLKVLNVFIYHIAETF